MPTYSNETTKNITEGGIIFRAGEETKCNVYVVNSDLTFVGHEPRIYVQKRIHDGPISATPITTAPLYSKLLIKNLTDNVLTLILNEDAVDSVIKMAPFEFNKIDHPEKIGHIAMSGSGSGDVYIYGIL